jgi:hypothetical protein
LSHRFAGGLEYAGCCFGKLVGATVNDGVALFVKGALGIEHLARFV